jgi:hypothetical protein
MGTENSSTCCKDDVRSPIVAFIVGGILTCPQILVFLVIISAAGPRCIRDMATKLQHEKKKYSNFYITCYVTSFFGPALLLLGCFQVFTFDKVFYAMVVSTVVGCFCFMFAWLYCGLYVKRSFDREDFSESLATRLVGDVDRLMTDDLRATNVFQDLTGPTATRAVVTGISQIILLYMYVWGLWVAGKPDYSDPQIYAFYILGIFIGNFYLAGQEDLLYSQIRNFNFWCRTIHAVRSSKHSITTKDNNVVEINWNSLRIRWFLCTLVNTSGFFVVLHGLPLQVAQGRDPIDFVLNVVAAFYIIEIDNIDPIELRIVQRTEQEDNDTTSGYHEEPWPNGPADSTSSDQPKPEQNSSSTSGDQVEQDQDENNVHVSPIQKWIRIQYRAVWKLTFVLVRRDKSPDIEEGGPPVHDGGPPVDEGEPPVDQDCRNISSVVNKMAARLDANDAQVKANDAQVQELKIEVDELRRKLLLDAK